MSFVAAIQADLRNGVKHNKLSVEKLALSFGISNKNEVKELTELAIVTLAREIAHAPISVRERYAGIVNLYKNQVNLSHRTSQSILLQQYSTPAPIAFLAGVFCEMYVPADYFEPSAGNGLLTIAADPSSFTVNEIDAFRRSNLEKQGYKKVMAQDATNPFTGFEKKFDAVITNPPFGSLDDAVDYDGFPIKTLDHLMSLRALDTMKDSGKAAIIIGGHTTWDELGRIQAGKNRIFFNYLYSHYNVVDVININGDLNSRQGTSFDVRLILIDGRKTVVSGNAPLKRSTDVTVNTFDELFERVMQYVEKTEPMTDLEKQAEELMREMQGEPEQQETATRYRVIYYPIGKAREFIDGFTSRQSAWEWVKERLDTIDYYTIDPYEISLGLPYQPASDACTILNLDTPDNMAYETQTALLRIKREVGGDLTQYVREKCGYKSRQELCDALAAEQIDAVAMAIYNIEQRGQGMIIGDQTGIGKGRTASAVIRYAVHNGYKPIFFTEKPNLFSDLYRDMKAIGSGSLVPFIVNRQESKTDIKDDTGEVVYTAPPITDQERVFAQKKLPAKYDYIVTTYSQINSAEKRPAKPSFLFEMAKGNIVILDESHNASGESNTGELLKGIVAQSLGTVFLSATFAKRPDNMPIYAVKTAMSEANMSKEELIEAINKGGTALQEIVSSQLVQAGQMLRRQRTYQGIEFNFITLDALSAKHAAISDTATDIIRGIIAFQNDFIEPIIDEMDKIVAAEGKATEARKGTEKAGVDNLPYFSKVFQVINQLLFSIKAEAVADLAIQHMRNGKKPVIAFFNTMESFIDDLVNESGFTVGEGETVPADFSIVLKKGFEGILKYTVKDVNGKSEYKMLSPNELPAEARAAYLELANKIDKIATGITLSPIDLIAQRIKEAGFTTAEVTGRKYEMQLNKTSGGSGLDFDAYLDIEGKMVKELNGLGKTNGTRFMGVLMRRKKINVNDAFRMFNDNEVDCLLLNQSGATGASAHAIPTKKVPPEKVKQRVMINIQPELDINKMVQKLGRINRTGQIRKPQFDFVSSAIPAEKRLMMMLSKKLKSLDANTTSNQNQSDSLFATADFLNKYGDRVVKEYMQENPLLNLVLDDPLNLKGTEGESEAITEGAAMKVTGRVAILSVKEQEKFYSEITDRYNDLVEYLKQTGEYDLEVEVMDLQAETQSIQIAIIGKGGTSAFAEDSILEKCLCNVLKKPYTFEQLRDLVKESLTVDGKVHSPELMQKNTIEAFRNFSDNKQAKERNEIFEKYHNLKKEIRNEKAYQKLKGDAERIAYVQERTKEIENAQELAITKNNNDNDNHREVVLSIFEYFKIGYGYNYPVTTFEGQQLLTKAIFLGYQISPKRPNPYALSAVKVRFALADSTRYLAIPLSLYKDINAIKGASYKLGEREQLSIAENWNEHTKASAVSRKTRYIVTGNLLQAFGTWKGKLVSYSTNTGATKKGILMPDNWMPTGDMKDKITVPVGYAKSIIMDMTSYEMLTTNNGVNISRAGSTFQIIVPASHSSGGQFYLDKDLLALVVGNNFDKVSNTMRAYVPEDDMPAFIDVLQKNHSSNLHITHEQYESIKKEIPARQQADKTDELELEAEALALELELLEL